MSKKTFPIRHAKIGFSPFIARLERGARILLVWARKPVAELRSAHKVNNRFKPLDDPLLRVEEYRYDGPIGPTANEDIDRTVCGN